MVDCVVSGIGNPLCLRGEDLTQVLLDEYGRVVMQSIATSFGLDFVFGKVSEITNNPDFAMDQYGGDVDTIHNVRLIGEDQQMRYKSRRNAAAYSDRGKYDSSEYHRQPNYVNTKHEAREAARNNGTGTIRDAYTSRQIAFTTSKRNPENVADLDHVIAAKEIHDDRGRVLAGLRGPDLADNPDNLQFTNAHLNRSMGAKSIEEYIEEHRDELSSDDIKRMREVDSRARRAYEDKVAANYYMSSGFRREVGKAAFKQGGKMAVRQVCGLVFVEMWFAVKDQLADVAPGFDLGKLLKAVGRGIVDGFECAKEKYKQLLDAAVGGALAGALASVANTLCNIFFATAKTVGKIIRESYASLVDAGRILLFNPDVLPMGEQLRAATKILATGASVIVGTSVGEIVSKTPIVGIPVVGDIVVTFCSSLVAGVLSCTLLLYLDRSEWANALVGELNRFQVDGGFVEVLRRQAEYFAECAAQLAEIDLGLLKEEISKVEDISNDICLASTEDELNAVLHEAIRRLGIALPWNGTFDEFMNDHTTRLEFS